MIEASFLTKITFAILEKAVLGCLLTTAVGLNVCGLQVVSGPVVKHSVDYLVSVGKDTFVVDRTNSGLYIASTLVPAFRLPSASGLVVRDHRRYGRDHRVDHRADQR